MRILHVIPGFAARTGGVATNLASLVGGLGDAGVETTIYTTDLPGVAGSRGRVAAADFPQGSEALDVRVFPARPPRRLAWSPALARAVRRDVTGFDVVHVHSLYLHPQLAAAAAARRAGVPYIVALHGSLDPYLRRRGRARKAAIDLLWQRRLLSGAAAIHLTCQAEAALVTDIAPGVPRAVLANAVDCDAFARLPDPAAFRTRHLGGETGPVVLNLGRVARKKGLDILVAAFAEVARSVPGARLVLAGPDDEGLEHELRAQARAAGIADAVVFTGMLRGDERLGALAAADVWALPSRADNFALAVIEALAAGKAVVTSPAVNIAAELEAAGAAVVVSAEPRPLARELVALLQDSERRQALGDRGRAFVQRYEPPAVAAEAIALYERVIRRAQAAPLPRRAEAHA